MAPNREHDAEKLAFISGKQAKDYDPDNKEAETLADELGGSDNDLEDPGGTSDVESRIPGGAEEYVRKR